MHTFRLGAAQSLARRAVVALVAASALLGGLAVGVPAPAASADVGAPSWWNGDCNAAAWNASAAGKGWTGVGAYRLGASYLGVPVCGPRPGADGAPNVLWTKPGWGELEWQCPELAFRFMAQFYGVAAYGANGGDVVRNYTAAAGGGLVKVDNGIGSVPPLPGDVISFDNAGAAGHVGVVASSSVDTFGNGSITMLSQNDTSDGWRTLPVVAWHVQNFGSYVPYGWLHDPLGRAGPASPPAVSSGGFHPLAPVRILDSRDGTGGYSSPWGSWDTRAVAVAGVAGVPADAKAVVLNVTVTDTTAPSYLTVWPAGQPQPTASNLNWPTGDTRPNLVVAKLGVFGAISIYNLMGTTNVVADVEGWFDDGSVASADALIAVSPTRVLDSRDGTGGYSTPWTSATQRDLTIAGVAGVPGNADAVLLNVTVTNTTAPSYLTVWPAGAPPPTASNLNWPAGDTRPNLVVAKLGGFGAISIYNLMGNTDVVADVEGWFDDGSDASADALIAVSPTRVLDSRDGTGGYSTPWASATQRDLTIAGMAGVPGNADAVLLNVTVTDTTAPSYLTVWPAGAPPPTASNLNWPTGDTRPNLVVAKLGTGGAISIYNLMGTTDVVADVVGYFGVPSDAARFSALAPVRILDSRDGTGGFATPWGASTTRTLPVAGIAGVPANAKAVMVNLTVTNSTASSYLTAWPSGPALPLASNLNFTASATVPNLALVPIGPDGRIAIFNLVGPVDVIADVVGYTR